MKLTREVVQEAISLGKDFIPNFTVVELARILNVPLLTILKCVRANQKVFRFADPGRIIQGLDATNAIQTMNSNEVWSWYLKKRLDGDANRCMTLSDQNRLNASVNSRVKWEASFGFVTATFATNELTGSDVRERVNGVYGEAVAKRLVRLGTVSGSGQIPDRYLYGVIVTEDELKARKVCGLLLYSPEWAMEEMLTEVDWTVIDTGPRPGVQWIKSEMVIRGDPIDPPEGDEPHGVDLGGANEADAAVLVQAAKAKAAAAAAPSQPGSDKKINRRTKEQLDAERARWNRELLDLGASPADAVKCFNLEKFKEAEEFYKTTKASLTKPPAAPTPDHPGQQELPGTAEARTAPPQPETPLVVQPPPSHPRMPTLADLENVPPTVKDLKADIAAKAGMAPPANPGPAATPAAAVAQAPSIPLAPPMPPPIAPPGTPPPAGASASAEALLDSLLKSTGQTT
jgi:hypothetical protein